MKKKLLIIGGVIFFLFVIVLVAASGNKEAQDSFKKGMDKSKSIVEQASNPTTQQVQNSPEQQIEQKIRSSLKAQTNNNKDKISEIRVNKSFGDQEGYVAIVTINVDDNLTDDLTKKGIWKDMSQIYTALYKDSKDTVEATVIANMDLTDKYGNKSNQVVLKTSLASLEASKVNWNQDESMLYLEILPKVWNTQTDRFAK